MIPELPYKNLKGSPEKNTIHSRTKGPIIPVVGSIYNSNGPLPGVPSYSKIGNETILSDPDNYEIKHRIEITPLMDVSFNGVIIARSPKLKKNAKGKDIARTQAEKLKFCKAVVWGIDPSYQGYVIKRVKNSSGQMEDQTFPDDLYFRELIAKYPAVPEVITVSAPSAPLLTSPMELSKEDFDKCFELVHPVKSGVIDPCPSLTLEEITGYPNTEELLKGKTFHPKIPVEALELSEMEAESIKNDEYDNYYSGIEHSQNELSQMYDLVYPAVHPVIVRAWTHGCMKITEEVRA